MDHGFFSFRQKKKTKSLGICPKVSPFMSISKFPTTKIINFLHGYATERRCQMTGQYLPRQ